MRIALVADVEDYAVAPGVVDAVERHAELHRAEVAREMPARMREAFYQKSAYFRAQPVELLRRHGQEVGVALMFSSIAKRSYPSIIILTV